MTGAFPLDVKAILSVLNYLNVGVYITDLDRRIVVWNRKAEEITGYRAEDVVGKACHENVLTHADKDGHELCHSDLCPFYKCMRLGKESDEPVLVYARNAGNERVAVTVSVAPLHNASGDMIGGIEVFRDETQQMRDLELARKIQRHLMPESLPEVADFSFDVLYFPHQLIGGDFYDVRKLDPGHVAILVADVSGHGLSAALYTMWLRSLEESSADAMLDAPGFLSDLNRKLTQFVVDESFATAFYGVLDIERGGMTYCNAGHPAPFHFCAAASQVKELKSTGPLLGVVEEQEYGTLHVILRPEDMVLFYTDGVTEVTDKKGKMLGEEGLKDLLVHQFAAGQPGLLERLYQQVRDSCAHVSLSDDVLLLSTSRRR